MEPEKLEIKHIVNYLEYELQFKDPETVVPGVMVSILFHNWASLQEIPFAIVEDTEGFIHKVPSEHIKFISPPEETEAPLRLRLRYQDNEIKIDNLSGKTDVYADDSKEPISTINHLIKTEDN